MSNDPKQRIKVLVVDDSALVRKALTDALSQDPEIEVVGSACDPYVAREKIVALDPDVLTLDLEMPRMDGLTFLRILMQHHPLPVVVVSSLTQAGSQAAMDAVEAGAVDVLAKPGGHTTVGGLAEKLAFHVKAAAASTRFRSRRLRDATVAPAAPPVRPEPGSISHRPAFTGRGDARQLIVIGSSTGGIEALRTVLPHLPEGLPPIAIVQHISAYFSKVVAERLDAICPFAVREAEDGMVLHRGTCVIAPGDQHLTVHWEGDAYRARLVQTPAIHHCRPSVDVLFRSAAEAGGKRVVAALLTGMGSDGALGMKAIREAGGATIAEHERTCVVYGMPRAAIHMGVVEQVVPLPLVSEAILESVTKHR
jgi:two-component system chemotaxis response regulator CheB